MDARASAKYLRGSAQKARLVVDLIRGKNVNAALALLQFTNKRAAGSIEKCVRSAVANATELAEKQNIAIDPDDLWVKACFVDIGPTKNRKRTRPAPQGRAYREQRHFCHVTVLLSSDERVTKTGGRALASKAGKAKTTGESKRTTAQRSTVGATDASKPAAKPASRQVETADVDATPEQTMPVTPAATETSAAE